MNHLGMEQQRVELALVVRHRRDRRIRARREHGESFRRGGHEIAVTGPHADFFRDVSEERRPRRDADFGVTEFALRRRGDAAAERMRHQLHAVADAEHRPPKRVDFGVACRRARFRHALRSARQDDPDRVAFADLFHRRVGRPHFRIHRQLAESSSDQLGVLRAEIENDDRLVVHSAGQRLTLL